MIKYKEQEYKNFLQLAFWLVCLARCVFEAICDSIVQADYIEWEGEENYFGIFRKGNFSNYLIFINIIYNIINKRQFS